MNIKFLKMLRAKFSTVRQCNFVPMECTSMRADARIYVRVRFPSRASFAYMLMA